ncbi:hypothetical protein M501DRAFT_961591 [Patellaria atrata CBS 101060]|uniref:UBR-type domain-containing protein n=1 Tax=Patellaria atrata CBS 101060 TaxID=1346257 RepID=A0A9P4S3I3_9PEZI|nr:hypothetical protein M501DRAFT_961591 [Patellaria atrata CBS 101060]
MAFNPISTTNGHAKPRANSISQASDDSQTAQEFINSQLQLEADAREALPYQFDTCTQPLGPLRQILFSCLTCNPPPSSPDTHYQPAGVCYSCSISCHGEHTLVELFNKRNFVCDCGTTRFPESSPCTLQINPATGTKGGVHSTTPHSGNTYNQNFRNRFCGCEEEYDAHKERGTMFQCIGLGTVEDGGCGEDWWHPECVVGLERSWHEKNSEEKAKGPKVEEKKEQKPALIPSGEAQTADSEKYTTEAVDTTVSADGAGPANGDIATDNQPEGGIVEVEQDDDPPLPPGFPNEDNFEHFVCYKCVAAFPWIKRYAGSKSFLPPVFRRSNAPSPDASNPIAANPAPTPAPTSAPITLTDGLSKKRKALDDIQEEPSSTPDLKRQKSSDEATPNAENFPTCRLPTPPPTPDGLFSLFLKEDFRSTLCRCADCYPLLKPHPALLDEEDTYEPPMSVTDPGDGSVGTGSLLDRGEAALSNVDRVRAIEGVMVYNHLKDKVKSFLQPFAESGKPVGAEDIKKYFEALRGDAGGIAAAFASAGGGSSRNGGEESDQRKEQGGY